MQAVHSIAKRLAAAVAQALWAVTA